ncbi:glycosyltransferase family A protein [Salinigranum marinum]|uniref:glycosyltransferase family 2 protein n=1 Tax=Salinigranum marinum TaxID=1515595 RepID=UPI002989AC81|nr:glycosyltransferase family A protein [Salinigranum marinum]
MSDHETPLVSVVIPTYGRAQLLSEAVHSVLNQSYQNIELLIVDDASPEPVADQLGDLPPDQVASIEFIRHEENKGANVARNTGIKSASGDYIAFLDDDDRWMEEKISRQVETFAEADSGVGVVYTWLKVERAGETTIQTPSSRGDVLEDLIRGESLGQFSSVMVDTSAIEAVGMTDERFPIWQDREWFFRLATHCNFEVVPEPLTIRKKGHDDQISSGLRKQADVAYPLFLSKHRQTAAKRGRRYEQLFISSLRLSIGKTALYCDQYGEARYWFFLSVAAYPFRRSSYPYLFATLGGEITYQAVQVIKGSV